MAFPFLFSSGGTERGVPRPSTPPPRQRQVSLSPWPCGATTATAAAPRPTQVQGDTFTKVPPTDQGLLDPGSLFSVGDRGPGTQSPAPSPHCPLTPTMPGTPNERTHLSCCWCSPWSPGAREGPWGTRGPHLDWRPAAAGSPAEPAGSSAPDRQWGALPPRRLSSGPVGTEEAGADSGRPDLPLHPPSPNCEARPFIPAGPGQSPCCLPNGMRLSNSLAATHSPGLLGLDSLTHLCLRFWRSHAALNLY